MYYNLTDQDARDLEKRFTYNSPKDDQTERYQHIRNMAMKLATAYATLAPRSREQSLALTALEESVMWVNAAIARNE